MKEKPFALIGVNSWTEDPQQLKQVMTKEKLNWRSFAKDETINRQWNTPPTPTMYVIDHSGTIRHKWVGKVGGRTIDAALAKLLREVD